jgi:hypothetical protein
MCFGLGIAVSESTEDAVWVWGRKRGEMPRYAVKGERVS